jgi:hypothetical protein
MHWSRLSAGLVALCLSSCVGGQTGQGDPALPAFDCEERKAPISAAEVALNGLSAEALVETIGQPRSGTLSFTRSGAVDTLTLSISISGAAQLVTPGKPQCAPRVDVGVTAALVTDDGRLMEMMPGVLAAESFDSWRLDANRSLDELAGSYDGEDLPLDTWTNPQLYWHAHSYAPSGGGAAGFAMVAGELYVGGGDPNPLDNQIPVTAAVGDWSVSAQGFGGGGGGAQNGGGNGSPGGAGGTAGGANFGGAGSSGGP